jgi:TolB protein
VRTITPGSAFDETPAWSPDGRRIAFSRTLLSAGSGTTYSSIWTMDPSGRSLRRLTHRSVPDMAPDWSPNGRLIAFARARSNSSYHIDLWQMRPDGSRQRLLARDASHPAWSPDGSRIAFGQPKRSSPGQCCARDLYAMNANGTGRRLLARDANQPSWSPDGTRIVYTSVGSKHSQLWVIDADGANRRQLTHFHGGAYSPAWRPR